MDKIIPKDFVIKTARCILRCPSEDDIPHIFAATKPTMPSGTKLAREF
jgi:hypothetical protein